MLQVSRYVSRRSRFLAPREESWQAVHRAADRKERYVARAFRDAVASARRVVDGGGLNQTLANRSTDPGAIDRVAQEAASLLTAALTPKMMSAYRDVMQTAGNVEFRLAQRASTLALAAAFRAAAPRGQTQARFDVTNAAAVRWIRENAGKSITGISKETELAIRKVLADAYTRGLPNVQIIKRIRGIIGLNEQQVTTLIKLGRDLATKAPGTLVTVGKLRYRVPKFNLPQWAEKVLAKYSQKLLNDRAKMIARTETIAAANQGQRQAWQQAAQRGMLDKDAVERVWIITPDSRLCPHCAKLKGQRADIDGSFHSDEYGELDGPPAHPQCRCAQGLVPKKRKLDVPAPTQKAASGTLHKHATTQVDLPHEAAEYVRHLGLLIPHTLLEGHGRETQPHITVLYGVGDDAVEIGEVLRGFGPAGMTLGRAAAFEGVEDGTADAVYLEVSSSCLARMRKLLEDNVEHVASKHGAYIPHATIAYVKLGTGKALADALNIAMRDVDVTVEQVSYRSRTGGSRVLPLTGEPRAAGEGEGHEFHGNQWTKSGSPLDEKFTGSSEAEAREFWALNMRKEAFSEKGLMLTHEAPGDMVKTFLKEGIAEGFATIGTPSEFVSSDVKTRVWFTPTYGDLENIRPDTFTYAEPDEMADPEDKLFTNALAHKGGRNGIPGDQPGTLRGIDVSFAYDVPKQQIAKIELVTKGVAKVVYTRKGSRLGSRRDAGEGEGHPFRGNQWTTVFHGTAAANVASIKEHGIRASGHGRVWKGLSKPGFVYATKTREDAQEWAEAAAAKKLTTSLTLHTAIIKVRIPKEALKKLKADAHKFKDEELGETRFQFKGDIPPEWIVGVTTKKTRFLEDAETMYLVVELMDDEPKEMKK